MKNVVFYSVAGSIIGTVAQLAGLGLGVVIALSLMLPPAMLLAVAVYKSRDIDRRTRQQYWASKRYQD